MSAAEQLDPVYLAACQFGMRGLRVFPTEHHGHRPLINEWQNKADNSVSWVDGQFQGRSVNLALCCGLQPNGWSLIGVDIDPINGGRETFDALNAEYGWDVSNVPVHLTPSEGRHLYYLVPDELCITGTNVLGPGIDTRGGRFVDGERVGSGFMMLPPSIRPSKLTGELVSYGAKPGKGLLDRDPPIAPEWLQNLLRAYLAPPPSRERHPSSQPVDRDNPWDWVRHNLHWPDILTKYGWTQKGPYWARPGKTPRQGTGGFLHDDGRFAIWTPTDIPNGVVNLGHRNSDGSYSISLADFITAYEFDGDRRRFGQEYRAKMPPPPVRAAPGPAEAAPSDASAVALAAVGLTHPAEFWEQLPLLGQLRDAAWAMAACPDAMLVAWLTHYATAIPAGYRLPAIVGNDGTFDMLSVLVGDSGVKKSSVMNRTEQLTPLRQRKDLLVGVDIGSGEGIIDAFYDYLPEDPDDPKSKKEKRRARDGVNFKVDEGKVINDLNNRQGTTHTSRLCSAWSGSTLSTTNASNERKRFIEEFTYRVTAVICAQPAYAVAFLRGDSALQGFAQRLLWAWCHDPSKPEPGLRPQWPGVLDVPIPPSIGLYYLDVAAEIVEQIQWEDHREEHSGLDAHRNLLRLKVAGVLTLACGERVISTGTWGVAGQIVAQSIVVRAHLLELETAAHRREDDARAEATGRRQALTEDSHARVTLGRTMDRILTLLQTHGPLSAKRLKDKLTVTQRPYRDAALDALVACGKVSGAAGGKWQLME